MIRDPACTMCKLGVAASPANVCQVISQPGADVMVLTRTPISEKAKRDILELFAEVGLGQLEVTWSAVSKCNVYDVDATKTEQKTCATAYLAPEVIHTKPRVILALGGEALLVTSGRSGIMKYRGQQFEYQGVPVLATISPSMVKRNPGYRDTLLADLRFLGGMIGLDRPATASKPRPRVVMTPNGLKAVTAALKHADVVAFDLETNGFNEYMPESVIVSVGFTTQAGDADPECWAVPLCHPQSPWEGREWLDVFNLLMDHMARVKKRIAHNGKFDLRWINHFYSGDPIGLTFDTMLAAHLLNENRPKGLKPLAQVLLGAEPWDISTKQLDLTRIQDVLKYNALDTWYTFQLYKLFRAQLLEQPALAKLMARLMVPASNVFTDIEARGIWTDRDKLVTRAKIASDTLAEIDAELLSHCPDPSVWPSKEANFNPSNFSRWLLFEHLGLPVIERGKSGNPSMAEAVMQRLQQDHPHPVIDLMLARTKWQKYSSAFFAAYLELIDDTDHIHTTFKLTGTVTGRLSSGKGDADKVTGRVQNRGVNLQQVPRDDFVRGIFGAPPGHLFVECDYSQVELRVAAFLANEPNMLHLYNTGQDIHTRMAMRMTGKPESEVTKEERKKAKAVNFGFLYGMGWAKFIDTAWANYSVVVTEQEAQAFRKAFFDEFPKLKDWHNRQRSLVSKYGRVQSPLGRVRHLPDIESADPGVKAEAQRQSINSPVQSFASDMAVMALVSLDQKFEELGYRSRSVGTVHDAINFEVPRDEVSRVVPLIRHTMENLPLHRYGVHLTLPIIADAKIGVRWGDSIEVNNAISGDPDKLEVWIGENFPNV